MYVFKRKTKTNRQILHEKNEYPSTGSLSVTQSDLSPVDGILELVDILHGEHCAVDSVVRRPVGPYVDQPLIIHAQSGQQTVCRLTRVLQILPR